VIKIALYKVSNACFTKEEFENAVSYFSEGGDRCVKDVKR
jgi:hypothetical protein